MHKIITADILSPRNPETTIGGEPQNWIKGFVLGIEPPVEFNPDVVTLAYTTGLIRKADQAEQYGTFYSDAVLVGSTDERTTIYIGLKEETLEHGALETVKSDLHRTTVSLLGLMGIMSYSVDREVKPTTDLV